MLHIERRGKKQLKGEVSLLRLQHEFFILIKAQPKYFRHYCILTPGGPTLKIVKQLD